MYAIYYENGNQSGSFHSISTSQAGSDIELIKSEDGMSLHAEIGIAVNIAFRPLQPQLFRDLELAERTLKIIDEENAYIVEVKWNEIN